VSIRDGKERELEPNRTEEPFIKQTVSPSYPIHTSKVAVKYIIISLIVNALTILYITIQLAFSVCVYFARTLFTN